MAEGIGILIRPWVRKIIAATALNGLPIRYPTISPTTNRWMLFNPISNAYEDSGYVARGVSPTINVATGNWELWNDATQQYEDSGFPVTGPQGEAPQWRMDGNTLQYRYATQSPTVWTDLYTFTPLTYTHNQTVPSAYWEIQHNLGGEPITCFTVDDTGEQIVGQIDAQASTMNLLVIKFSEPLTGRAYIKL